MADDLFIRDYKLTIGTPEKNPRPSTEILVSRFVSSNLWPLTILPEKVPQDFKEVTGLQIKATVYEGKSGGNSQTSTVKVYNLSDDMVDFIKADQVIILEAGYVGRKLPIIFSGQVAKVVTTKEGQDRITEITCGAAYKAKRDIRWSNYWPKGTTYFTILNDILEKLKESGLTVGVNLEPGNPVQQSENSTRDANNQGNLLRLGEIFVPTGLTIDGNLLQSLEEICRNIYYRVYFVRESLYVEAIMFPRLREKVIVEEDTIKKTLAPSKASNKQQSSSTTDSGLKVNIFLDGNITSDKRIDINFGTNKGSYEIKTITHMLDFEGSDWDTELEVKRLNNELVE